MEFLIIDVDILFLAFLGLGQGGHHVIVLGRCGKWLRRCRRQHNAAINGNRILSQKRRCGLLNPILQRLNPLHGLFCLCLPQCNIEHIGRLAAEKLAGLLDTVQAAFDTAEEFICCGQAVGFVDIFEVPKVQRHQHHGNLPAAGHTQQGSEFSAIVGTGQRIIAGQLFQLLLCQRHLMPRLPAVPVELIKADCQSQHDGGTNQINLVYIQPLSKRILHLLRHGTVEHTLALHIRKSADIVVEHRQKLTGNPAGDTHAVGDILAAGPIHLQFVIQDLLLHIVIDRIGIQPRIPHVSFSQTVEALLGIGVKPLGVVVRRIGGRWRGNQQTAAAEIRQGELNTVHGNIAGGTGRTGDDIHFSGLNQFDTMGAGIHNDRFILQSCCL